MVLVLSINEADYLDPQHRRNSGTTGRHNPCQSAYRAHGLVYRLTAAVRNLSANVGGCRHLPLNDRRGGRPLLKELVLRPQRWG